MSEEIAAVDIQAFTEIVNALNRLDPEARRRVVISLGTLYGINPVPHTVGQLASTSSSWPPRENTVSFAEDRTMSAKEFVWQKQPKTAIERVVCLAYYLQHFRGMPSFKTSDISALNTEAAQVKFSNPAMAVSEATRAGYLSTVRGLEKQLTVIGEQFVMHLPDREAAANAVKHARPKRARRRSNLVRDSEPTSAV
jgi:hypothetical protein